MTGTGFFHTLGDCQLSREFQRAHERLDLADQRIPPTSVSSRATGSGGWTAVLHYKFESNRAHSGYPHPQRNDPPEGDISMASTIAAAANRILRRCRFILTSHTVFSARAGLSV